MKTSAAKNPTSGKSIWSCLAAFRSRSRSRRPSVWWPGNRSRWKSLNSASGAGPWKCSHMGCCTERKINSFSSLRFSTRVKRQEAGKFGRAPNKTLSAPLTRYLLVLRHEESSLEALLSFDASKTAAGYQTTTTSGVGHTSST